MVLTLRSLNRLLKLYFLNIPNLLLMATQLGVKDQKPLSLTFAFESIVSKTSTKSVMKQRRRSYESQCIFQNTSQNAWLNIHSNSQISPWLLWQNLSSTSKSKPNTPRCNCANGWNWTYSIPGSACYSGAWKGPGGVKLYEHGWESLSDRCRIRCTL